MIPRNLKTVETWYKMPTITSDTVRTLEKVFQNATTRGNNSYFFQDIWIPLRQRNSDNTMKEPPVYKYEPVGITTEQMAQIYRTLYSRNLLSVPLINWEDDSLKYAASVDELSLKMKSILNLNLYKYLKWIETMGYAYNPLWNVDGTESFQFIDNHGKVTRTETPYTWIDNELSTAPYDSATLKATEKTRTTYNGNAQSEEEHDNVTTASIGGDILTAVTGGDFSHVEKRIRQGNIGVTKTTELINDERELVKFNLIQEFFNDINKQLLIGIYI